MEKKKPTSKQTKLELEKENARLKKKVERLEHDLIHDELTGLKTRKYFAESVKAHLKFLFPLRDKRRELDAEEKQEHVGFLFCDIDFFKKVNDTLGHAAGDEVLKQVSRTLEKHVRDVDIVARFGGEEIVIALLEASKEEAERVAEKLREAVGGLTFKDYPDLHVTVSIGVSSTEDEVPNGNHGEERRNRMFDEYVRRADAAVYVAKDTGRNRVVVWSPEHDGHQHSKTIREKLIGALRMKRE